MDPIRKVADAIRRTLAEARPDHGEGPLLVAASGGPDSTALALGVARIAEDGDPGQRAVRLAHIDHGRHAAREDAPARTEALARALGVAYACRHVDPSARAGEAELRELRYAALASIAREYSATALLTAHHADDDVETVLLRAIRGTGPRGLAGVPRVRPWLPGCSLLRPLLALSRDDLRQAAAASPVPSFDDPGNRDLRRARNALRLVALPEWRTRFGSACDARVLTLARAARRRADRAERRATNWLDSHSRRTGPHSIELAFPPAPLGPEAVRLAHRAITGLDPTRIWLDRTLALERTGARTCGGGPAIATRTRAGFRLEVECNAGGIDRAPRSY